MDKRLELTPQQIAQKYVDEIITDEYLMNIGEIRDLDAISWFDETYPNLTDLITRGPFFLKNSIAYYLN